MIHKSLRDLKSTSGLSYQQISDLSGVPSSSVNRILNGTTEQPSFQAVAAIVRAMGGSLDEVAGFDGVGKTSACTCCEIAETCREQLSHIESRYQEQLNEKNTWLFRLFLLCCGMLCVFVVLLIVDICTKGTGFIT